MEKILFSSTIEEAVPRAIGVEISRSRSDLSYRVGARKEVILTSGAFGSPQLLLLSGIGPASDLQKNGIPVVKDLASVGRHLSDVSLCFWGV